MGSPRTDLGLASPDRSKTVVITLWADEAAMREDAGKQGVTWEPSVAETAGTTRIALEDYEVTFYDEG